MKRKHCIVLLAIVLSILGLVTAGCEKNGKISIYNTTKYPVYAGVLGNMYIIEDSTSQSIEVTTEQQTLFTGDVGKYVNVRLRGETYQIWDNYLEKYVDSSYVWVNAGETTKIYVSANQASVKIKNISGKHIKKVLVHRNKNMTVITDPYTVDLPTGETWFTPIPYASNTNLFYLLVEVIFDDNSTLVYGGPESIYRVGEQFYFEVMPVDYKK